MEASGGLAWSRSLASRATAAGRVRDGAWRRGRWAPAWADLRVDDGAAWREFLAGAGWNQWAHKPEGREGQARLRDLSQILDQPSGPA